MSANLTLIENLYDSFRNADFNRFKDLCHPDLEWRQNDGFPGGGTHLGAQAVIDNVFKAFGDTWTSWAYDIEEMIDGRTHVVVLGHYRGTHKVTGRSFSSAAAHVYDIDNGRIRRFRQFADTKVIHDAMAA